MKLPKFSRHDVSGKLLAAALAVLATATLVFARGSCSNDDDQETTARGFLSGGSVLPPGLTIANVKSFGAKGDGTTDDRAAIENAITAASVLTSAGVELYFPPGTYKASRNGSNAWSINLPAGNVVLQGVHGKSVLQHPTGMPNASVALVKVESLSNVWIRDMVFDGNWQNGATYITEGSNAVTLPQATINVADASGFPSGSFSAIINAPAGPQYLACTGKTSTTLTGCSGGTATIFYDQRIGYVDVQAGLNHTTQTTRVTTIAAGSNGAALPQATINVAATAAFSGFASGDVIRVATSLGYQDVTCTGTSGGNSFTGCTGGVGTMSTGGEVFNGSDPKNYLLQLRGVTNVTVEDSTFKRAYGDCIWIGRPGSGLGNNSRNVRLHNFDCDMTARDGIAVGGGVDGLDVDHARLTNILGQAVDTEPQGYYVRNISIAHSYLGNWFNPDVHTISPLSIVGASIPGVFSGGSTARNIRIHDNEIRGPVIIQRAQDTVLRSNRIILDFSNDTSSAVLVQFSDEDITIDDNYIYSRPGCTSCSDNGANLAGIQVTSYQSGVVHNMPSTVRVTNNRIHVRNGRYGIHLRGVGGSVDGSSFTATGITSTSVTVSGGAFSTNQFTGQYIRCGTAAVAGIASNTATMFTLDPATLGTSSAWVTPLGEPAPTPAAGACVVLRNTSVVDVDSNYIDGTDDGYGKGKGIKLTNGGNNETGTSVRIRRNVIRNVDTNAIEVKFDTITAYPFVEITDNIAHDDQGFGAGNSTTNLIKFTNAIKATKFIMRGNVRGVGVTNQTSGLSSGTWLVNDGICPEWAGYTSPESVVTAPICARYSRVDGGTTTSQYFKESGTGNTGWIAK
jgi:hypothetical protein